MRYSISACSFYKSLLRKLLEIPEDFGVEIFTEFGSDDLWNRFLCELSAHGFHGFSIHAPFAFVDIAADCDEEKLFDTLRRPFDLYHRYHGEFYVLHPYGRVPGSVQEQDDCRKRSLDRLAKFHEICKQNGVRLGAENLCTGAPPLFDQEQFLQIFKEIPDLSCVIDIGHALVTKLDIAEVQRQLGSRICAYHLHNNNGLSDQHERLRSGIMDWKAFAENYKKYTPEAIGVLEYLAYTDMKTYVDDRAFLDDLLKQS